MKNFNDVFEYIEKTDKNEIICINGYTGVGKTMMACNIAGRYLKEGKNVLYLTFDDRLKTIGNYIDCSISRNKIYQENFDPKKVYFHGLLRFENFNYEEKYTKIDIKDILEKYTTNFDLIIIENFEFFTNYENVGTKVILTKQFNLLFKDGYNKENDNLNIFINRTHDQKLNNQAKLYVVHKEKIPFTELNITFDPSTSYFE